MHAARGDALHRLRRFDAAKAAFERAADLATTEQARRFLWRRLLDLA